MSTDIKPVALARSDIFIGLDGAKTVPYSHGAWVRHADAQSTIDTLQSLIAELKADLKRQSQ
jgi:hypothetical protein